MTKVPLLKTIYQSCVTTFILAILLCGVYPAVVYGLSMLLFHSQATGGLIEKDGKVVGARLIGQSFTKSEYFHGRPSSAGDKGYDAANSSGSNLGPTHQKFYDSLKANVDLFLKENPSVKKGEIPNDIVTASGSGLDPHISPQAAYAQTNRVAIARNIKPELVRTLIAENEEGPQLGLFGEPIVNVLLLNLDLDKKYPLGKLQSK